MPQAAVRPPLGQDVRMTVTGLSGGDPVAIARRAVLDLVERELAVAAPEVEARLCEHQQPGLPRRLDPVDVRQALSDLVASGQVRTDLGRPAAGRRAVPIFTSSRPADPERTASVTEHKRDLLARYLSWVDGPDSPLQSAADHVVHASLQVAARSGYRVAPAPPIDVVMLAPTAPGHLPGEQVLMPLDVRHTRAWLVPETRALYPLLVKAVRIHLAEPDAPVVPMFVCRRAHPRLLAMGHDLGFLVVETRREFISPTVAETAVSDVRVRLGLTDLTRDDGPDRLLVSRLEQIVPGLALPLVARWRRTAGTTMTLRFAALAEEADLSVRRRLVREVHAIATTAELTGARRQW